MSEIVPSATTMTPGARLAHLRRIRGWSQRTLASHAGLNPSTVSRIESGRRAIRSWSVASALATALGCPIDELLDIATGAAPEVGAAVPLVRRALIGTGLRAGTPAAFRGWDYLSTLGGLVNDRRASCAYRAACRVLPEAIEQAHASLALDRPRGLREVAKVCLDTSAVALGRGDTAVAWIAGVRAADAAAEAVDAALSGAAELVRARVAHREQALARCLAIAEAYLSTAPRVPVTAVIRGLMHLLAGLTAAHDVSRPGLAAERHVELAGELARTARPEDDRLGLDFSEAVVWQTRLRIALVRVDLESAAAAVRRIDPDRMVTVGDRATFLVDLARMQLMLGRHAHALRLVEQALGLAREHVGTLPATQALLADMLALRLAGGDGRLLRSIYRRTQTLLTDSRI